MSRLLQFDFWWSTKLIYDPKMKTMPLFWEENITFFLGHNLQYLHSKFISEMIYIYNKIYHL